ncbi:MAG: TfuA-like protein [Nocardioides sp.]|uniref:TfuA-like protein n=1 Tax=Nocardioides sp. TaxID=35761 RepID=UPI0039E72444
MTTDVRSRSALAGRHADCYRATSRLVAPHETWARIQPLLTRAGITRIVDHTGLDELGIPVYAAVRPSARCLHYQWLPNAEVHPPVSHGDPLRIDVVEGDTLAIIDGLFFQSSAVRHKELLYLIERGVRVVGASSMGALRAAELNRFGMRGIGQVYEAYAAGTLIADDEVAVVHGDADEGWISYSDPLVNLRAAAERAELDGTLNAVEAAGFVATARSLHFGRRRARDLVRLCERSGVFTSRTAERFREWLITEPWNAKQEDARQLLNALSLDTWIVRPRDNNDWRPEGFPQLVYDWVADFQPLAPNSVTRRQALNVLQLFASNAPEAVAHYGAAALRSAWGVESDVELIDRCGSFGQQPTWDENAKSAGLSHYLSPLEQATLGSGELVARALARHTYRTAQAIAGDFPIQQDAIELAAEVSVYNERLATTAPNARPEYIASITVLHHFKSWWGTDVTRYEVLRRGFASLDEFVAAARPYLPYAVSKGMPTIRWDYRQ